MSNEFSNSLELLKAIYDLLEGNKQLWKIDGTRELKDLSSVQINTAMRLCKRIVGILKNLRKDNAEMKLKNIIGLLDKK